MKTYLSKFTILFLILLFSGFNVFGQVPNYVPTNGLVGYWPFNGNANDASGNGNNGNVLGANLTTDENGNANSAYNFNYTGMQWNAGLHQTINIPYNSSFNSNTISVSIWFYARSYFFPGIPGNDKVSRLVTRFQDGYSNPNGQTWGLDLSNNQLSAFVLQASSANNQISVISSTNISLNQWYHVTFTFDNISLKLYLNGVLVSETPKPSSFTLNTNGSSGISIGCSNQANGYWYESDAKIDKFGFWNRALTQAEVTALHTSNAVSTTPTCSITTTDSTLCLGESTTLTSTSPSSSNASLCTSASLPSNLQTGLVGYWPFCGNANDLSGNGNHGTVNGATLTTDRFGNANSAYSFDGVNDYIRIINSSSLNNASVAISGWLNTNNLPIDDGINAKGIIGKWWQSSSICNSNYNSYLLCLTKPSGLQNTYLGAATDYYAGNNFYTSTTISTNNWYHFTFIHNSTTGGSLYINGNLINSNSITGSICNSINDLIVGADNSNGNVYRFFNGKLDDIGIWNRALSASEIQQLYTQGQTTYSWSPGGATTPSITVSPTATTTYTCTTTVNGVSCSDSITITVDSLNFSLPTTTTVCGATTPLTAPAGATSYLWNTGATTASISPTTSGLYACQVTQGACSISDTTALTLINSTITAADTTLCLGQSTTLSVATASSSPQTNCGTLSGSLANGLVGYWPFCGNANDVSGNGNNGTVNGATLTTDRFGNANSAYSFDGNDWIAATRAHQSVFTASVWVQATDGNCNKPILDAYNASWELYSDCANGQLSFIMWNGVTYTYYPTNVVLGTNTWYHVVAVYSSAQIKIYINGSLITTQVTTAVPAISGVLNIGASLSGSAQYFTGKLDDVGTWNRALSVSEIQQLYSQGQTTYSWSPGGATTPSITVSPTATTTYTCTTTVNGVSCSDSITITVDSLNFSLPTTTTVCGATTTLTAPSGATSYLWNTGATTASISPTTSGLYVCQVTQGACVKSDTTQLTLINSTITAADTTLCLGQSTTLSLNNINTSSACNLAITPSSIPLGQPKPGFTFAGVFNNHYYYVYNSPTSWTQGELICRQNGGYLACINDAAEDAYVTNLTSNNIWIGLFRNPQTCDFEWLDCSTVNYTNWRPGEPNSGPCGEPYGQIIRGCSFGLNTWNNLDNISVNGSCYSNMYPILEIDPQFQQGNTSILWSNGATTSTITVSPTQTTTYTVTTTVNGVSCSDSFTIVVDTALAVVTLNGPSTFCANDSLQLTANSGTSYLWSTNDTTQSITVNQSGTYSVIVTNTSGCTAYSTTTNVLVNPLPTVFAGIDTSICIGDTLLLSGSGALSYTWNGGIVNGSSFVPAVTSIYTVTGTDTNGCVNTDQVTITVNSLPTINAGIDQPVCIGSPATLQATGGVSYSWNNGIIDNVPFTPSNSLIYTVTGTDINGCVNTDQVTVTVNPLPNVNAGQDQAICFGSNLLLNGSGASSYIWNNGVVNNTLFTPSTTTTYTVTGTDNNGCVNTDQVVVTVNPLPIVSAGNDVSICFADTIVLIGSGASNYSWNSGISNGVGFAPTTTATYTLTGTDTNGCVNTDQVTITVNSLPTINAGVDQAVCIGSPATLQATGGASYSWNNGIIDNVPFTPSNSLIYTVTGTDINGCVNTDQVTVTVIPLPNVNAGQDQAICFGSNLLLNGSGASSYIWNNGVVNNTLFTPSTTTTYTVTGTDNNGCVNTDQVVVTVLPLPTVFAGNDTTVCAGEPLVFSGSGAGFYLWNNGITNATTFSATTTSTYVVTGIDNNNCTDTDTLQLIVEPLPIITTNGDIQICAGELVTLSATSNGTLQWNNGVIDNAPFQPTTTTVFTVSSLGSNGCVNSEQVLVTVNPLPNANFNTPYFSQGSPNTTFNFTNTSTNSDQVVWDFGDGIGSSTMNNPIYTYPLVSGTYPVTLIVVSDFGCTDTVIKIVRVINNSISSEVIIPTGFSPNNDGANDTWTITGLANYPQASINVFNRWGQKVFEGNSTNYSWDGTFNNQLQPVADYYYIIELNDATKYNGIVTLKY